MNSDRIDFSSFPYGRFSEIRIKNGEPLTFSCFNSHIIKLCSNLESLGITNTLQKATYSQWGTVRMAKPSDISDYDAEKSDFVLTNKVVNDAIAELKLRNSERLFREKTLSLSKNYDIRTGEFTVGRNERIAKKITDYPSLVVFTKIDIYPIGFEEKPFYTTRTSKTDKESFSNCITSSGKINFSETDMPKGYSEFHAYYHRGGYVICDNGNINDSNEQIRIGWIQISRKA